MIRAVALLLALIAPPALADMRPIQEWPLGTCADNPVAVRICLDAPNIWQRFGHGAPEIEVAVVETFETFAMGQILSQHPYLQHIEIPQFWHARVDDPRAHPRPRILQQPEALRDRAPEIVRFCENQRERGARVPSYCDRLEEDQNNFALAYLDWRNSAQHELKMIGLISGQSAGTLRRTGLTPLGSVSLHYVETDPTDLRDLISLKRRLDSRANTRVVNYSNEGRFEEMLDRQYARIYRTALVLNAGRPGVSGQSPQDRLVVASSANTTGVFAQAASYPAPNPLLPPETSLGPPAESFGQSHRPVIAYELPAPQVPVLVVGGITADGTLAERTRIEPMIDLYAPSGVSWRTRERSLFSSAVLQLETVQALQGCRPAPMAVADEAVVTLDWGETRDIRRSLFLDRTEEAWRTAGAGAIFGPVGCFDPGDLDNGVFLGRIIGNSVATALVSATAAQMFALDPQLSAMEARTILVDTARANRVSGLPVLDATAALETVLARYVIRNLNSWQPGATLEPGSIRSESIAPGFLGQQAWRALRDDPPLKIDFGVGLVGPGGDCIVRNVSITTHVDRTNTGTRRIANVVDTDPSAVPCRRNGI